MSRVDFHNTLQQASRNLSAQGVESLGLRSSGSGVLKVIPFGAVPFGEDYKHLNKLAFYTQECARIEKENPQDSNLVFLRQRLAEVQDFFVKIFQNSAKIKSPWQKAAVAKYIQSCGSRTPSAAGFLHYIVSSERPFLPKTYSPASLALSTAEINFPSADVSGGRDTVEFTHLIKNFGDPKMGGILASHVPHYINDAAANQRQEQAFLEMLYRRDVKHIVALGGKKDRFNYQNHFEGRYQTALQTVGDHSTIVLTDTQTGHSKRIHFIGFSVGDQKSVNLADKDLQALIAVHELRKNELTLIHCDSGVGRTGQITLLLKALEAYEIDPAFQAACNNLQSALLNTNPEQTGIEKLTKFIYSELSVLLYNIRGTRYSVETEEQFIGALPQLVLLLATQQGASPDILAVLRNTMGVEEPNAGALADLEKEVTFVELHGSDSSSASTPGNHQLSTQRTSKAFTSRPSFSSLDEEKSEEEDAAPPAFQRSSGFQFGHQRRPTQPKSPLDSSDSDAESEDKPESKQRPGK